MANTVDLAAASPVPPRKTFAEQASELALARARLTAREQDHARRLAALRREKERADFAENVKFLERTGRIQQGYGPMLVEVLTALSGQETVNFSEHDGTRKSGQPAVILLGVLATMPPTRR